MTADTLTAMRRVIRIESETLRCLSEKDGDAWCQAVELLGACTGQVVVTGMGKSGLIGRKMAATFASTGTPSFFLHPAEAYHGDLGVVTRRDVLVAVSHSGETEEVIRLLPYLRRLAVNIVSLTGKTHSTLARLSDLVIDMAVSQEADPFGIIPSASTTAVLAMGDALAVALMCKKGFNREDYQVLHPGGTIGRKLLLRVRDLMHIGDGIPKVSTATSLREAICVMTKGRLGAAFVVATDGRLIGILTDGDLRRLLQRISDPLLLPVEQVMIRNPKTISGEALAADAVCKMEDHAITVLPVIDAERRPIGAIHLHDLVQAGLA